MPNENVYTEAHGFKFPNGTTIPIEDAEARQDISEIKSSLSDLFTTRSVTLNVSVSNEWYKNYSYTPPTVDGYTPIAIQSWFCGAVDYYPIKVGLDSVYIVRYVHTAETKTITFTLTILYAKTAVL